MLLEATNGMLELQSLVQELKVRGIYDVSEDALLWRYIGVFIEPCCEAHDHITVRGPAKKVSAFLLERMYLLPAKDFNGYAILDVKVLSGVKLLESQVDCSFSLSVQVHPTPDDPVFRKPDQFRCQEDAVPGCKLTGLSLVDPDCVQVRERLGGLSPKSRTRKRRETSGTHARIQVQRRARQLERHAVAKAAVTIAQRRSGRQQMCFRQVNWHA